MMIIIPTKVNLIQYAFLQLHKSKKMMIILKPTTVGIKDVPPCVLKATITCVSEIPLNIINLFFK